LPETLITELRDLNGGKVFKLGNCLKFQIRRVIMRLIACLILLLIISVASADSSKITTGPYNITFDLNTPKNYAVEVIAPLEDANYTSYSVVIDVPNETRAGIYIWDLKTPEDATITTVKEIYNAYTQNLQNSSVEISTIDGKDSIIAYYVDPQDRQAFLSKYWLDSKKIDNSPLAAGSIEVQLLGTMPRNSTEGMVIAKSLINTLHIEKFITPSAEAAKTVAPVVRTAPYIRVSDQNVENNQGAALIDEAFSDGPGWVVIYNEKYVPYSKPLNGPIGYTHVNDGRNENVKVNLNMALITDKLYAVLYKDEGQVGTFEYPGPDLPLDLLAEKSYSFYSNWPHPLAELQIDWRNHMFSHGPGWM
jgi:hypothetical protein